MKKLVSIALTIVSAFVVLTGQALGQNSVSSGKKTSTKQTAKRGPIFRATKEQINQAQSILKSRGFYSGEQIGKLDDATREGLRKYQEAEGIKVTGTLNRLTLEKMNIPLTDKQKAM